MQKRSVSQHISSESHYPRPIYDSLTQNTPPLPLTLIPNFPQISHNPFSKIFKPSRGISAYLQNPLYSSPSAAFAAVFPMENPDDPFPDRTHSIEDPSRGLSEFDPRRRLLSQYNHLGSSRMNTVQDIHLNQALNGLARLSLSSDNDRILYSGADSRTLFESYHSNRVNGRFYYPYSEEDIFRQNNVGLQRKRFHNADVSNIGSIRPLDYRVGFDYAGLNGVSHTSGTVQHRSINEGLFADERRWLVRGDRASGELSAMPFKNQNGFLPDLSCHYKDAADHLGNFSSTRRSGMNNRHPHWLQEPLNYLSEESFQGRVVLLAKDQYGCRFLQKKLEDATEGEINDIFLEAIEHVRELMVDPYGNYVIQKLVEVCGEEQRTQILLMVTRRELELARICLDMHGTRSVQKLLEHLTTQEQISIVMSAVRACAYALTTDMNGHHVIQYCLKYFSAEDNMFILTEVVNNCFVIATDKSGCCVLQQCVEHSTGEIRERLIDEISANAPYLSEDRYGNYVVQRLLELRIPQITKKVVRQLEGHYLVLSCNKYGSNVVQKCLLESGEEESTLIINELLSSPHVSTLLLHPYGNYVIQSALSVSKDFMRGCLQNLIRQNVPMMRDNMFGKKLLAWINKQRVRRI